MANDERDASHIWLRQSVQFTVGEQQRTIEIALPLPVGATPHEVERLLAEADAGMARLGQHLDQQMAAALGEAAAPSVTPAAAALRAAAVSTHAGTPAAAPTRTPAPPAPAPSQPAAATASTPAPAAPLSAHGEGPEARTPNPAASRIAEAPAAAPARPAAAPARPAPAPSARAQAPLSAQGERGGEDSPLARPDFLAETRALGLTPPQVMERLGVRSLDGLNLREALEMLRRQLGTAPAMPEPPAPRAAPAAANGASARATALAPAAPPAPPVVFDEEEEFELVVLGPDAQDEGDESLYGDDAAPDPAGALDALDALDDDLGDDALDDVPDLGTMLATPPMAEPAPEPARSAGGSGYTVAQKARARELVAGFRAVAAGGSAIRSQHTAFANVVADQLSAASAATLVRGLWGQPPERLGADQLDAVIRWGKQDEFAEEAPVVLALLRAEHARKAGGAAEAPAPAASDDASDDASPAPPARPARGARKPAGDGGQP